MRTMMSVIYENCYRIPFTMKVLSTFIHVRLYGDAVLLSGG